MNEPHSMQPPISEEHFDEVFYLATHQDVHAAVARGDFRSGWEHFQRHGLPEGRPWRPPARLAGFDFAAVIAAFRRQDARRLRRRGGRS